MKPIKIKKDNPNICIDGCVFTKLPTGTANCIIIKTEIITAVIIMYKAPGTPFVIPTAVKILSKEKTKSIRII
jgi:hypothetical protein